MHMVRLPLSMGYETMIDDEDAEMAVFKWSAVRGSDSLFYAYRQQPLGGGKRVKVWLHRAILERKLCRRLLPVELADHRNGNGLDNRRENLRIASKRQNQRNCKRPLTNTSGYKGVHYIPKKGMWRARIRGENGRPKSLGTFASIIDAAVAYDRGAIRIHGEFANINFSRAAVGL